MSTFEFQCWAVHLAIFTLSYDEGYHDIQSKGVEFLRGLYSNGNLRIYPKAGLSTRDQLLAVAREFGLAPEEAARLLTTSEPHRAYASRQNARSMK